MRTSILLGFILLAVINANSHGVTPPDALGSFTMIVLFVAIVMDVAEFIKNMKR